MPDKKSRVRLDTLIFTRGLSESRERAQRLVLAGEVLINDQPATKPGQMVDPDCAITIKQGHKYVSRGGVKLSHALDRFKVDPTMSICADVGASTGGFTDCLLQYGAKKVYAIDVGYGQLAWKLRQDPRVITLERQNARYVDFLPEMIDIIVMDVSFISVEILLPVIKKWLSDEGQVIILVKPQFEAGRKDVGKGGVVRDAAIHRKILNRVSIAAITLGYQVKGVTVSPITGPKGNIEFLMHLVNNPGETECVDHLIDESIASAYLLHQSGS